MLDITAQDIRAAFQDFEDFQRVQVDPKIKSPSTLEEAVERAKEIGPEMVPGLQPWRSQLASVRRREPSSMSA